MPRDAFFPHTNDRPPIVRLALLGIAGLLLGVAVFLWSKPGRHEANLPVAKRLDSSKTQTMLVPSLKPAAQPLPKPPNLMSKTGIVNQDAVVVTADKNEADTQEVKIAEEQKKQLLAKREWEAQQKESLISFLFRNGPAPVPTRPPTIAMVAKPEKNRKPISRLEAVSLANTIKGVEDPFEQLDRKQFKSYPTSAADSRAPVAIDWRGLFKTKSSLKNIPIPPPPPPALPLSSGNFGLEPPPEPVVLQNPVSPANPSGSRYLPTTVQGSPVNSSNTKLVAIIGQAAIFTTVGGTVTVQPGGYVGTLQLVEVGENKVTLTSGTQTLTLAL